MCRSLDELIKSRSVHLNRTRAMDLVSINIKPQKHLNMNPACSASLLMNDTGRAVSFTAHIHTRAHVTLAVTSASAVSLNEDIKYMKQHPQNCLAESLDEHLTVSFE